MSDLEKKVEERERQLFELISYGHVWTKRVAKQTLIWELEARIEELDEHWTKGDVRLKKLQSELEELRK